MSDETPRDVAFDQWCRATYPRTLRRLMNKRRDLSLFDAQEIVQDAYHKVYKAWSSLKDPDGFLWHVTCKLTIDHWRKRQRVPEVPCDTAESFSSAPAPVCDQPEQYVDHAHLVGLIDQMTTNDQQVLGMQAAGASSEEQAELLGIKLGTAKVRLHRAKMRLEKLVAQEGER